MTKCFASYYETGFYSSMCWVCVFSSHMSNSSITLLLCVISKRAIGWPLLFLLIGRTEDAFQMRSKTPSHTVTWMTENVVHTFCCQLMLSCVINCLNTTDYPVFLFFIGVSFSTSAVATFFMQCWSVWTQRCCTSHQTNFQILQTTLLPD